MSSEKIYNVTNRSGGMVVYRIPEMNVRRVFTPGETKRISYAELEALTFRPGGKELMAEYLQIKDAAFLESMNIHTEPEYFMSKEDVEKLILSGSLEAFEDAVDFAPAGVIEMIKDLSVSLPLSDYNKRAVLKKKLGFDVDAAIINMTPDAEDEAPAAVTAGRRTQPTYGQSAPAPERRTTGSTYNIIEE